MGIRILEGRGFAPEDAENPDRVAVVEETMARLYWPDDSALGKCLQVGGAEEPCTTVVGIAENTARDSLTPVEELQYYVLTEQNSLQPSLFFVRVAPDDIATVVAALQAQVRADDPGVRYVRVEPLTDLIDPQARSWQLGATMFSIFGALALVIAAVGLYAVLAFNVAQRRHEIGVRSALGADGSRIVRLIVSQAVALVVPSVALGLVASILAGGWVEPLLYDVSGRDSQVLAIVFAVLLAVGLAAAAVPARRAVRVSPMVALRGE